MCRRILPALREAGEVPAVLWGRDGARARAVADHYGVSTGTSDVDRLVAGVDAVYVATPVAAHLPLALAAARAGRHVLVEKPLRGALPDDPAPLVALTRRPAPGQPRVTVGVAYYRRLDPALQALRERLRAECVERVTVHFRQQFEPTANDPKRWRTDAAVAGGGVLADAGSHRLDLLCWLLGEPAALSARLDRYTPGGAEQRAQVRLHWPAGAQADCRTEWASGAAEDTFSVSYEGGEVLVSPLDSGVLSWRTRRGEWKERFPRRRNPQTALVADFARAVTDGRPPACPLDAAILVDALLTAASSPRGQLPPD